MAESALNVIDTLRNKTAEILSRPNNPELEKDFRTTCSAIQKNSSLHDPLVMQAYQDYLNAYQQKTSLYNIKSEFERSSLIIYSTETETEEVKTLQRPGWLNMCVRTTQLPNGKLFYFGHDLDSAITMLIGVNGGVEMLPSGTSCKTASCIYFNNSVYCFGEDLGGTLTIFNRFDLNQNRWIKLTPMPKADSMCNMIIFNGNILISGWNNRNLWFYSIDIDSFSTIPYEFEKNSRKILINAERLYLIECRGWIYESEVGSLWNWRRIRKSNFDYAFQVYCVYNKGGIYISTLYESVREYYYFNLDQKIIIDITYESSNYCLRRVGKKIEAIKWNSQAFKLDPYYLDEWSLKGNSLRDLGNNLEVIIRMDKEIKKTTTTPYFYYNKGCAFYCLERYLEAIECFDEAIKLDPYSPNIYNNKGNAFYSLKRYLEAIECYDKAITLNPYKIDFYHNKGKAFYVLERYLEAIECYEKAIELNPKTAKFYNDKGNTLYALERFQEAMQCYDEAIKLEANNPLHFCSRAKVFNNLRQEDAALQDFNTAYNLWPKYQEGHFFIRDEWKLSEQDIKFISDVLGRDRIELLQKMQI